MAGGERGWIGVTVMVSRKDGVGLEAGPSLLVRSALVGAIVATGQYGRLIVYA